MTNDQVRIGMIGTGKWANWGHLSVYQTDPRVKVVAVCDIVAERAERAARQFGAAQAMTDYHELLGRADIDAVDVATPNAAHAPAVLSALEARKHVMCEKPLAMNAREARQMAGAAQAAGVKTGVNFVYRCHPAARFAHHLVQAGHIGRIFHVNAFYMQSWLVNPHAPIVWRLQKDITGTGVLGDLGSHIVDLAEWVTGERITSVIADMQTFVTERPQADGSGMERVDVDDGTNFLARFENGAMGAFVSSRYGTARRNYQRLEIYGEKGALVYLWRDPDHLQVASGPVMIEEQAMAEIPVPIRFQSPDPGDRARYNFGGNLRAFVGAILDDAEMVPNFGDGLRNQEVLEAIEVSARDRRWVDVPLDRR